MRIGGIHEWKQNAHYRLLQPLEALRRRGHEVRIARAGTGHDPGLLQPEALHSCAVVHGYRMLDAEELRLIQRLVRAGSAFVWDTDDDLAALPRESPHYRESGGVHGRRLFERSLEIARLADVVTTSTEALAERYRRAGLERVEVLPNYLAREALRGGPRRHDGFVVGWTAGLEHASDAARIPIVETLRRMLDADPTVRVVSLGLDLGLPPDRYEHHAEVPFARLQDHIARWDVGIAPLADIPFNRVRSDVKLKEYASVGIPWLASPVGPYAGYGEAQGGRLVADEQWGAAIEELTRGRFARRRLGRRARSWAKSQSIERHVARWEAVYAEAIERRAARRGHAPAVDSAAR
ncbi:MAG TPA: hypothetical protein VFU94_13465 [Conexibacter sp.]|nr:hypothetical protein [Conexibacter sp.]